MITDSNRMIGGNPTPGGGIQCFSIQSLKLHDIVTRGTIYLNILWIIGQNDIK